MGTTALLSFEEFERLPDEPGKSELLEGERFQLPPALRSHMLVVHELFAVLTLALDRAGGRPGLGRALMETGYKLGSKTWVIPDVSVTHFDQTYGEYFEGAPAIAVEVVSHSNTARQIDRKRRLYLAHGGVEVWVLYPDSESAWVYRESRAEEFTGEMRSEIIPDLVLDLKRLFASA